MSADNWAVCPRCKRDSASPDEYDDCNFREDYEQGVFQGEYFVEYRGQCTECGLKHTFKHKQALSF